MLEHRSKVIYFVLEALGSLACGYYANYIFFLFRDRYGFGNLGNLSVSASMGLVFAVASWQGGRFAQRRGYLTSLAVGLTGIVAALCIGGLVSSLAAQVATLMFCMWSTCFVWPALEALVSEGENQHGLWRLLGGYNVTWATCSACSYFLGGALFDSLGRQSIFWLPAAVSLIQLGIVIVLMRRGCGRKRDHCDAIGSPLEPRDAAALHGSVCPRTFLHMAWLANPFACIGINTLVALVPGLAQHLQLSTTLTGLFCSIWFFARLAAFAVLWRWKGWQYRFRWLLGAFLGLMAGFTLFLTVRTFWVLVLAQVVFGLSVGLIYYSSLFYSMHVGETKGEHGGLHEAAMGAGQCVGPAVGAMALLVAPQASNGGAYAVSGLLLLGLMGLIKLRLRQAQPQS